MGAVLRFPEGSEPTFGSPLVLDHKIRFSLRPLTWRFILGAVLRCPEGSEPTFSSLLFLVHDIRFSLEPVTWIFI